MTAPSLTISTIENGTLALSPSERPVLITGTGVSCQSLRTMTERPHQAPGWATREKLLACLLLSVAYVVAGRVGLLLSVWPGYATAVFLPAGFAVASMYLAGPFTLVGTFFGSFVLNVWVGSLIRGQFDSADMITGAVIALAAATQAAIGGALLRRAIGHASSLDMPRDLFYFLLLTPIFCLTSATLSVAGIWAVSGVKSFDVLANWIIWWVGDTLGVIVGLPVVLVFAGQPRELWRGRALSVAAPMILSFGLFAAIFVLVSGWEKEESLREYQLRSQQLVDTIGSPSPLYVARHRDWQSWAVMAGGVLGTGLIGALLLLGTGQTHRLEKLTEKLRASEMATRAFNEKLEAEVERRTRERDRIWKVSEDLLGVSNFEGYFVSVNPAWTRLLGWTEEEIKSMHVTELRHPDDALRAEAGRGQLARGVPAVRMENRFRRRDGSWCWISWTMTAEDGLIYVAGRHTTLEKEAAAALETTQRQTAHLQKMEALGQLTGGVAHDFNNLLMVVSGYAQTLLRRLTDPKDVRPLQAIQAASLRGESLTRQLLAFSRGQPVNPTDLNLAKTLEAIRDVLSGSLNVNIDLVIDIPDGTWPIRADKAEFELALVNLAVNARDAMPRGGTLLISAENTSLKRGDIRDELVGDFVALTVKDTGSGIPRGVLDRVFEPFFTTKAANRGTGLGLSQVYGFSRRSGGSVSIASEIDQGTTVTIYLPRSQIESALSVSEDDKLVSGDRELILVVEDNPDVRDVSTSLLGQLGYRTMAVENAREALEVLESHRFVNLILTDVVIPGEYDGLTLARWIRVHFPEIPIVLATGYAKLFDSALEFPVLRKPYQIGDLARAIHEGLKGTKTRSG